MKRGLKGLNFIRSGNGCTVTPQALISRTYVGGNMTKVTVGKAVLGCRQIRQVSGTALTPEQWDALLWRIAMQSATKTRA